MFEQWYANRLLQGNALYDKQIAVYKKKLFSQVYGRVLEIGPGAGENFEYFPSSIQWTGVEPNKYLYAALQKRLKLSGLSGKIMNMSFEQFPCNNEQYDAVVSSLVLCSVPSVSQTLDKIYQVLKPKRRYYFLEHGVSDRSVLRILQHCVQPLWYICAGGCHPNRNIALEIQRSAFHSIHMKKFTVHVPIISPHIAGYVEK